MSGFEIKKDLEQQISELPSHFSSDQIREMYDALVKDISDLSGTGMTTDRVGTICQRKHRVLAFAYPSIFFKTVKGEMKPDMLNKVLGLIKKMENKEISLDEARVGLMKEAKEDIKKNPVESRPKKATGEVQEMIVKVKPDGSAHS